jgi:hypothetical protein
LDLEAMLRRHFPRGDARVSDTRFVFEYDVGMAHPQGARDANGRYVPPPSASRAPRRGGIIVEIVVDRRSPEPWDTSREESTGTPANRTITGHFRRFPSERLGGLVTVRISYSEIVPEGFLQALDRAVGELAEVTKE